ncbi:hypothetical protein NJF44_19430 [Pseudomonas guariconensis]|nr:MULTISPECIES: hypothetical protein [Pseudomonas]MCO7517045.1 hypothetical protein [Pseudomonas putida]MCO7607406.1 hypothetical protein [Pseudomonas guariconensis]
MKKPFKINQIDKDKERPNEAFCMIAAWGFVQIAVWSEPFTRQARP